MWRGGGRREELKEKVGTKVASHVWGDVTWGREARVRFGARMRLRCFCGGKATQKRDWMCSAGPSTHAVLRIIPGKDAAVACLLVARLHPINTVMALGVECRADKQTFHPSPSPHPRRLLLPPPSPRNTAYAHARTPQAPSMTFSFVFLYMHIGSTPPPPRAPTAA